MKSAKCRNGRWSNTLKARNRRGGKIAISYPGSEKNSAAVTKRKVS